MLSSNVLIFISVPPQTALHWAAKHGHVELIKLLAGTYKSNVNAKSVRKQ